MYFPEKRRVKLKELNQQDNEEEQTHICQKETGFREEVVGMDWSSISYGRIIWIGRGLIVCLLLNLSKG